MIKLGSLGDLFHALPAVHSIKVQTGASVDWVVSERYAELVRCFEDVRRVIALPTALSWHGVKGFLRDVRRESYDLLVDLQGLLKSAVLTRLARGRIRIGPSFQREGAFLLYSVVAGQRNKNRHAVEECLDVVRFLGLDVLQPVFPVRLPVLQRPLTAPRPRVAIVPLSRWTTKNWPVGHFIEVARRLSKECSASLFVIGNGDSVTAARQIESALSGRVVNLAGRSSLIETANTLAAMDLVISNDSGPMHMAAALGIPVLALFGPTDPVRTGPFGPQHRVLTADVPCRPCFSRSCRLRTLACLEQITAERVAETALAMLTERKSRSSAGL
ncbi:MAG: glycosyltransferase family 9 protein [Kiritimatiellia bacterium]